MRPRPILLAATLAVLPALAPAATRPALEVVPTGAPSAGVHVRAMDAASAHVREAPPVELALNGPPGRRVAWVGAAMLPPAPRPRRAVVEFVAHGGALLCVVTLFGMGRARREAAYRWMLRR